MAMKYDAEGLHYWAPTKKLGGGWIAHKDTPTAPTPPDPMQTAAAQTNSNIATANATAQLNRVNQNTPWGSMTYTRTPGAATFDQAGYDAAMQKYQQSLAQQQQQAQLMPPSYDGNAGDWAQQHPASTSSLTAPDRNSFMTSTGPDQWTSNITLAPDQQKLLDMQNKISLSLGDLGTKQLGTVGNTLSQPLNFNGAPSQVTNVQGGRLASSAGYGGIQNDLNAGQGIQADLDTSKVPGLIGGDKLASDLNTTRDALYNTQTSYLDPQWQNRQHDLENQLAQQGVMQNSDAWNRAMDDFGRQRTFDYNQARQSAITGGGAEQSRLFGIGLASNQNAFGQALSSGQFHNAAQDQGFNQAATAMQLHNAAQAQGFGQSMSNAELQNAAQAQQFGQGVTNANLQNQGRTQNINEIMALRQQPLNELNALRTGSQVTSPQFGTVPQANVGNTDVMSAINNNFNGQMGAYNSKVAQNNAITNGMFSLGSAFLMA